MEGLTYDQINCKRLRRHSASKRSAGADAPGNRTYPGADPKRSSFCCRKRTPVCKRTTSLSRDDISYIAENGSLCIHQGKVISRGLIEDDLAYRILRELKKEPGFEIVVSREDTCLIENNNSQFANHIVNVMHNTTEIVDDLLTVKGPFLKIAFANMTSRRTTDCLKELQEKFSSEIKVVTSGNIWIDFIVPGCNKGSALRNLMDLFGITPEECVAFGDQYNDVEMLETVGMGYAMSNAAPGIAGHAKYITDSVEEVLEDILAGLDL